LSKRKRAQIRNMLNCPLRGWSYSQSCYGGWGCAAISILFVCV